MLGMLFQGVYARPATATTPEAEEFYRSHPIITIGYPANEIMARLLARHMPKFLPGNASGIVQYIPAAGGLALANQTFNTAPKDGTFLAMVRGSTLQLQINGDPAAKFDSVKFAWIGNMARDYDTCVIHKSVKINSIKDAYTQELLFGASAAGSPSLTFPLVYKQILGMKIKVISGYIRVPDRMLAMEQGELMGGCGFYTNTLMSSMYGPFSQGVIRPLFQGGLSKDPRFQDVPNILDEAKTTEARQALEYMFSTLELGRPIATAPETPADRVELLREAFDRAMKDPGLLEEAQKLQIDIDSMTGSETSASVLRLTSTPRMVIDQVEGIIKAAR